MKSLLLFLSFLPLCLVSGADFKVDQAELSKPIQIIDYGDMRFTDPKEASATNPKVRKWLVDRIASETPDAVLLSGDVPWHGGTANDYVVYKSETKIWRDKQLRVYPALGNHEFANGSEPDCLDHWWSAFPELKGKRYYSVQLGGSVFIVNLDSNMSLLADSEQIAWLKNQLAAMPASVRFVFLNLHHPPVVDVQADGDDSHNGRPNEAALAAFLARTPEKARVRFIVAGGHIHNYERFFQDGIIYLVSGGGGAKPRPVVREPKDLYQGKEFPNYHYVKVTIDGDRLEGTMYRVENPDGASPQWSAKDHFETSAMK